VVMHRRNSCRAFTVCSTASSNSLELLSGFVATFSADLVVTTIDETNDLHALLSFPTSVVDDRFSSCPEEESGFVADSGFWVVTISPVAAFVAVDISAKVC
jgi:hypothetical protein